MSVQNQAPQIAQEGKTIVDLTLTKIQQLEATNSILIPKDYSAANAIRAAALILADQKNRSDVPVLQACTKESICNALLKMVVQGLNPVKRQCSFIPYGNVLTLQREYQGSIAIAKRYGMKSVVANAIFQGDDFAFEVDVETGRKKILKHVSPFESYGGAIKGAYAIVEMEDGTKNVEIMTMPQIQSAWNQGQTKGTSSAHKNFPDQMACKTVINRATKTIINSSDDADLFEDDPITIQETPTSADVKTHISQNANAGNPIGFDEGNSPKEIHQAEEAEKSIPVPTTPFEAAPPAEPIPSAEQNQDGQPQSTLFPY